MSTCRVDMSRVQVMWTCRVQVVSTCCVDMRCYAGRQGLDLWTCRVNSLVDLDSEASSIMLKDRTESNFLSFYKQSSLLLGVQYSLVLSIFWLFALWGFRFSDGPNRKRYCTGHRPYYYFLSEISRGPKQCEEGTFTIYDYKILNKYFVYSLYEVLLLVLEALLL